MKTVNKKAKKQSSFRRVTIAGKKESQCDNRTDIHSQKKSNLQKVKDIFTLNSSFDNFFTKLIH
jgi:hypothetical protein